MLVVVGLALADDVVAEEPALPADATRRPSPAAGILSTRPRRPRWWHDNCSHCPVTGPTRPGRSEPAAGGGTMPCLQ